MPTPRTCRLGGAGRHRRCRVAHRRSWVAHRRAVARRQGDSAGRAGCHQSRATVEDLGTREAVDLDGGGSTTMVTAGRAVNSPSDATGERPVGDALLVLPRPASRR